LQPVSSGELLDLKLCRRFGSFKLPCGNPAFEQFVQFGIASVFELFYRCVSYDLKKNITETTGVTDLRHGEEEKDEDDGTRAEVEIGGFHSPSGPSCLFTRQHNGDGVVEDESESLVSIWRENCLDGVQLPEALPHGLSAF
jgi:hypothetical protein